MANTLKFGAGQWATKEGSTLAYNDENDNYKPLPFTFTRASNATVVNKAGLIETVSNGIPRIDFLGNTQGALKLEPQRTNVITYSSDFPRTYWTKDRVSIQGDPSTAGSELVTNGSFTGSASGWALGTGWAYSSNAINATSSSSVCYQDIAAMQSNITYTVTYEISNYSGGNIQWRFGGTGTVDGVTRNANGTYTESFTNTSSGDKRLFLSPSGFTGTIDNVSVKEVQGFTAPDGTNNAYKVVEDSQNGVHRIFNSVGGAGKTASFFAKADERQWISVLSNNSGYSFFNVGDGSLGTIQSGSTATIEDYGNGWYRCSLYNYFSSNLIIQLATGNNVSSYQGNGTSGLYLFGSQVEEGSYSTSLINTQGSSVTRVDDNTKIVNSPILQATNQFTLFFDAKDFVNYGATFANIMITLGAGESPYDAGSGVHIYNKIWYYFNGSSAVTLGNCYNATTDSKFAISYDGTKFTRYSNGVKLGTNTISASMSNWDTLTTGSLSYSGVDRVFNIADLKLYNTALSDSELQALTTI